MGQWWVIHINNSSQNGLFSSRPALIMIITNHVSSHPMNAIILHLNGRYGVQSESCFTHTAPVVTSSLNDGNRYFTMFVINGHGAWDLLIKTTNINEFNWSKNNFNTVQHVHNESPNFIESYDAHSDTDQRSNFIEIVLVSGMRGGGGGGHLPFLHIRLHGTGHGSLCKTCFLQKN